jgi:hypothetical protein
MATAPSAPPFDLNAVVNAFLKIREARSAAKKEFDEKDGQLKASQVRLEAVLLDHLNKAGAESVRTEAGTFFRQEDIKPAAQDWNAFYDWIKEHNAFDALEKRITKTFIKEFMETNDGALPPGVSVFREHVVRVRRPS